MTTPLKIAICISHQYEFTRQRTVGAGQYAIERGWDVEIIQSASIESLHAIENTNIDGIITFGCDQNLSRWAESRRIPIIETARPIHPEYPHPCVVPDEAQIGRLAFEHLSLNPRAALAFIGNTSNPHSIARQAGFEKQVLAADLELRVLDTDNASTTKAIVPWLQALPTPTAIFTFDCTLGRKLIEACKLAGKAIPESISVLTVGQDEILCSLIQPPMSSIQIPSRRIGQQAAMLLEKRIHGEATPSITLVEASEIIARRSTRADYSDDPLVRKALEYITSKCHQALSVSEVAMAVGTNRRTLERRFNSNRGRSIHSEISARRIEKARELLRSSSLPIESIAEDLQYSSAASFSRAFKAATGCPPKLIRKK
ncbi:helix-turn-helix domain-containing protein [Coraliomargarita algicola]|uniref:Helix-turn-helix domain-containing protein n=1 Tax=Coraliomargarita algicola TaxID=3092156 RepID=A0ABZ0RJH2_9BACT|nr:substrate-binding domain-containing protein [Coraliomargarita sp. J2-16]WPJ95551.1 helix-turn-helix domain-containing protein [Coraliomargarita sp. J2-16]